MIRRWLTRSPVFNFNQVERDRWVRQQAALVPSGSRVLDVGAGSAPYRADFAHCQYRTQDFAQLQTDQLRDKQGYSRLDFECDIAHIPVDDNSFDVVLCTEVLEHVPEPIEAIGEISRVLRPGGSLILSAPLGSGLHQSPYHFYGGYTPYWYRHFLAENGFEQIAIERNGGFFKHYGQESIRLARLLNPIRLSRNWLFRLAWLPLWLLLLPWFAIVCPLFCHFADRWDEEGGLTVGYHVTARKTSVRESSP